MYLSVSILDVCTPAGHDVLLPCICSELQRLSQRFEVLWEDREGRILLDITDGNTDVCFQHQTFRGQVQSFPHLYIEGNVSVLLKSIQISDSNFYKCIIPQMDFKVIEVTVSGWTHSDSSHSSVCSYHCGQTKHPGRHNKWCQTTVRDLIVGEYPISVKRCKQHFPIYGMWFS